MQQQSPLAGLPPDRKVALAMAVPALLLVIVIYLNLQGLTRIDYLVNQGIGEAMISEQSPPPDDFQKEFAATLIRIKMIQVTTGAVSIIICVLIAIFVSRSIAADFEGRGKGPFF